MRSRAVRALTGVPADLARLPLAELRDECLNGAACLYDPECHDGPDGPDGEAPEDRAAREQVAAEVCAVCPVRAACLAYALRTRPARGIWAGLTAFEVRAVADALGVNDGEGGAPATAAKQATGAPFHPSTRHPAGARTEALFSIPARTPGVDPDGQVA